MTKQPRKRIPHLFLAFGLALLAALFLATAFSARADSNGNYALDFDGVSDFVTVGAFSNVIGPSWQTTKTISLWARPAGFGTPSAMESGDMLIGDFPRWFGIYQANVGGLDRIWVWNNDNGADGDGTDIISLTYTPGEWLHIAMVQGNDTLSVYKNGALVGSTGTGPTASGHPGAIGGIHLRIGGAVQIGMGPWETLFAGQLDEVQIWNVARTQAEIRRDMYRPLAGNEPGLRAYYSMSDGDGTVLTDDSVNSWHGALQDGRPDPDGDGPQGTGAPPDGDTAAWVASGALTGPRQALAFDGVDDYVDSGSDATTVIGPGWASTKSVELWVNPAGSAPVVADASAGDHVFGGPNWGISQANIGGEDRLWLWHNDGSEARIAVSYTPGEWLHVALIHAGGRLYAYRNGVLVDDQASGNTVGDGPLTIGGLPGGQSFQGQIDELRIWDDGRSALELQSNMFQTVAANATGLMAYYRFDQENEAGQTELVDAGGYGHHATLVNMNPNAVWFASTPFNTWVGGDSPAWSSGGNWSRYLATDANLGIARYPGSYPATVVSPTTILNAILIPDADLAVTDMLTVMQSLLGPGNVTLTGSLLNLGHMEVNTLTVAAGAQMQMQSDSTLTVTTLLQNNGILQQAQTVDGSAPVRYYDTGGYGGLRLDPLGQNLGSTLVTIHGNQDCTSVADETVLRCFDITPQIIPTIGISITFAFADSELGGHTCESVNVYHWNGSGWEPIIPLTHHCSQPVNFVTVENITAFSPFVLSSAGTPTAVTLRAFQAKPVNGPPAMATTFVLLILSVGLYTFLARHTGIVRRENRFGA